MKKRIKEILSHKFDLLTKWILEVYSIKKQLWYFIQFNGFLLVACALMSAGYFTAAVVFDPVGTLIGNYKIAEITIPEKVEDTTIYTADMTVRQKINFYATVFGVNKNDARRIADCESDFRAKIKNPDPNSSASGVYQFIKRTWEGECGGDVFNEDHNIICFMQEYPKHPGWWECK